MSDTVLSSLTAIGGLMPIALSTNPLISHFAIVIIGGRISSTILSRVVTPVVYKLIPRVVEAHQGREEICPAYPTTRVGALVQLVCHLEPVRRQSSTTAGGNPAVFERDLNTKA